MLIDTALNTTDTVALNKIMKEWVQVRNSRYAKWPQLIGETNLEAIEGTAKYIELKYAKLIDHKKKQGPTFSQALDSLLKSGQNYSFLERSVFYSTGAALGYILDRLDPAWKEKITESPTHKGQTQYQILKSRY